MRKFITIFAALILALSATAAQPVKPWDVDIFTGAVDQVITVQDGAASVTPVELNFVLTPDRADRGRVTVSYNAPGEKVMVFQGAYVRHGNLLLFHRLKVQMPAGDVLYFFSGEVDEEGRLELATTNGAAIYLRHV